MIRLYLMDTLVWAQVNSSPRWRITPRLTPRWPGVRCSWGWAGPGPMMAASCLLPTLSGRLPREIPDSVRRSVRCLMLRARLTLTNWRSGCSTIGLVRTDQRVWSVNWKVNVADPNDPRNAELMSSLNSVRGKTAASVSAGLFNSFSESRDDQGYFRLDQMQALQYISHFTRPLT